VDPLGEPSTAESSFSWVLFLNIRDLVPVRSPKHPLSRPLSLTTRERPGKAPRIPGAVLDFRGHRPSWISGVTDPGDRLPSPPLSPIPMTRVSEVSPTFSRACGPAKHTRGHADPHKSRVTKAQPIEYRDHRDHRSLGLGALQRSPRNSSFGEHKCTLMKHSNTATFLLPACETTRPSAAWRASRAQSSDERRR
jgi:hypothetical protein